MTDHQRCMLRLLRLDLRRRIVVEAVHRLKACGEPSPLLHRLLEREREFFAEERAARALLRSLSAGGKQRSLSAAAAAAAAGGKRRSPGVGASDAVATMDALSAEQQRVALTMAALLDAADLSSSPTPTRMPQQCVVAVAIYRARCLSVAFPLRP